MTETTEIAALRPSERAKLGFVTDDNTGGYYVAECEECGQIFPSQNAEGGGPIADSGDYDDCYCPHCGHVDPEECDNANLVWNVQQLKIVNLTKQLEAERQQREAAEGELAELRGEQEPVGLIKRKTPLLSDGAFRYSFISDVNLPLDTELFTRQPKPVVVLPAELDFDCELEKGEGYDFDEEPWARGRVDGFNEALQQCDKLMRAAGIVVKDGE
ncbi:hypothetical protein ACT3RT_17665 [Ewingella sp. AOP9-I1-14]